MSKLYQIAEPKDSKALAEFLNKEGELLLPMLELIEQAEMAVDELIDVMGRTTIEAVLTLPAQQIARPKAPGNAGERFAGTAGRTVWLRCRSASFG